MRTPKPQKTVFFVSLAALLIMGTAVFFILKPNTSPTAALKTELDSLVITAKAGSRGRLAEIACDNLSAESSGDPDVSFRSASQSVKITYLDTTIFTDGLDSEMQTILSVYIENAYRKSDIYNEDESYRDDILIKAYAEAIDNISVEDSVVSETVTAKLSYSHGKWMLDNADELEALLIVPEEENPGLDEAISNLEYIDFHYSLPDWTSPGPAPNQACYGISDDPMEIQALLETNQAQRLINGQKLDWSPDKELIPGTGIWYYLDDTVLSLVWQECEHGAVGTFAETIVADASQLRRKLADDSYFKQIYYYPTELSSQANAVTAVSGDFYDHPDRIYGVHVYDGKVMGGSLINGQTCYITDDGDMIFSYEGQFSSMQEAQRFVDENNVMFSLCFGPVIVENGVDVTPYDYPLGEVLDTYARCAFGQLGKLHYLAMTINVQSPEYYVYVTLRQAADSIIRHGCINAYTLDGGQTGSIIIGNQLINPVQFGVERQQSDIIYFATAIPR